MSELFKFANTKTSQEHGHVSVDISTWLKTETINAVIFSARNRKTNVIDTSVIDSVKSTFSGVYLKPYIKNGVSGQQYRIYMHVDTHEDSGGDFFIDFEVKDF
jgi:hypothetical protein